MNARERSKAPLQFIARILSGCLVGATVGAAAGSLIGGLLAGAVGAVCRHVGWRGYLSLLSDEMAPRELSSFGHRAILARSRE